MKKTLLFLVIGMCALASYSQNYVEVTINQPDMLKADAGMDIYIIEGATAQIGGSPTAASGYGNYTYAWSPSVNLSDAAGSNPEATLQNSTVFFVTVTDAMECTSIDSLKVTVNEGTGLLNQASDFNIKILPNPNQGKFILEMDNAAALNKTEIIIRDISGKMVYDRITVIQEGKVYIPVNIPSLLKGNYFIEINNDCFIYKAKFVVY
jgi:hypothetical protein